MSKGIDWFHFEKKLRFGKSLAEACEEMGVDYDLAVDRYVVGRGATSTFALESSGHTAIQIALQTLEDICTRGIQDENRVAAAGHLLKFAGTAMKAAADLRKTQALNNKSGSSGTYQDLFDSASGDWSLKKPGV